MTRAGTFSSGLTGLPRRLLRGFGVKGLAGRRFERHFVCIPAGLRLEGRTYDLVGAVLELSQGGVLFREASDYILDRNGAAGEIKLPDFTVSCIVVASRPSGYGLSFRTELPEDVVRSIALEYSIDEDS